jgi:hypothetical protein
MARYVKRIGQNYESVVIIAIYYMMPPTLNPSSNSLRR